ncbi:MAG TPA: NAD(P)/FAD-dependent oxidoreductase [Methanomicrobia archaeon]|nr:NAD(P)/FAD-dependent oxidoreductase [Methanomicrobia archaeon]
MIIVGGGLGGLLAAALASREHDVTLFERAPCLGGRFRNIEHDGHVLTTGALHMVPHGSTGPLGRMLSSVGANVRIVDSRPWGRFLVDGRVMRLSEIRRSLPLRERLNAAVLVARMRLGTGPDRPVDAFLSSLFKTPVVHDAARAVLGWSISCAPSDVPTTELYGIVKNIFRYGGPGVPVGGCGAVVDALRGVLERNGVAIRHERVNRISVDDGAVCGVETGEGIYEDNIVVSDAGIKQTIGLCPSGTFERPFIETVKSLPESGGVKINVSTKDTLLDHTGVLFPLGTQRVEGVNQVTNVDPSLAPEGRHLVMFHQTLRGKHIRSEVERGIEDIEALMGERRFEVLCVQSYFGKNPVNRAAAGHDVDPSLPVRGLYVVGDSVKDVGGIEVDGIALGVEKMWDAMKMKMQKMGTPSSMRH